MSQEALHEGMAVLLFSQLVSAWTMRPQARPDCPCVHAMPATHLGSTPHSSCVVASEDKQIYGLHTISPLYLTTIAAAKINLITPHYCPYQITFLRVKR